VIAQRAPTAPSSYLTKITDQVAALISTEHAKGMAWSNDSEKSMQYNRLFRFEVAKTRDEEENVQIRQGFDVRIVICAQSVLISNLV
jgi:hypothetical protein